jgi:hypothetical protein|uniref:Uncharacterized protein n=1 Tax=viral metagenome TaxID=1070528 RepID=A0A6C0DHW6_9ZZZZ
MKTECVSEIHNETNRRIYDRNIPSQMLQPYIDVRPVMTKYSYLPIVDPRKELNVNMNQLPTFNPHIVFNPGNTQSPWSGFASNINTESELRNQIFALQKCSQSVYVPNSNSDLYEYKFNTNKNTPQQYQPHNLLFRNETFNCFNPNPDSNIVGTYMFSNSTRSQIREL